MQQADKIGRIRIRHALDDGRPHGGPVAWTAAGEDLVQVGAHEHAVVAGVAHGAGGGLLRQLLTDGPPTTPLDTGV